ncbi:MAG: 5'-methylthioadenosine/adenosylhomocysteine nucleosidase [Lachnospiraceae bacterium]|nr:5'-methylthioadenosine/adenosylhomocysteine nucleosidase [Lachnospiraceae bacterium]
MSEKKIGIIGAMDEEVSKLKECLEHLQVTTVAGMDFYEGNMSGINVVIVRSGIGKVNAAICTQILADRFGVTAIINTGIAGSLKNEINIGDIVLSSDAIQHDMDAAAFGYEPGVIPRMETSDFQASQELITIAENSCKQVLKDISVFCGRVLSGDQFISDKQKKDWLAENFAGYCTEMEGAAIAHAAYLNKIPFLIIRAISDKADDSAHMDYPAFEAMAIENSVLLLKEILREMEESLTV